MLRFALDPSGNHSRFGVVCVLPHDCCQQAELDRGPLASVALGHAPDDMAANDAPSEAPIDGPSREQISLWADDAALGPSGPQLRLE